MPVFEYKALDGQGREVKGIIDADSAAAARTKLRSQGLHPSRTSLAEERKIAVAPRRLRGISSQDLALPIRQLATLLGSGLPLVESLSALIEQTGKEHLRKIFSQIREEVVKGRSLSAAMADHPKVFSELQVNMIRAGESSGGLEIVLDRQAELIEKRLELTQRIRATLMYPLFMAVIGTAVLCFLMGFVVPTVTTIFEETGQILPLPTRLLISFGSFLRDTWWMLALGAVALILICLRATRTERGKKIRDRTLLKIPLWGALHIKLIVARFFRTLGTLLVSGVPLVPSLDISGAVAGNIVFKEAIESMKNQVVEGKSLALPLKNAGIFPPLAVHMIQSGEKSGKLENMLLKVAETYEKEVAVSINGLTSLLEPVMILAMGLVVGFIVLAILLPILEMSQVIR
jgi:general secretion pathway protein F